jgi:hypothetical protein
MNIDELKKDILEKSNAGLDDSLSSISNQSSAKRISRKKEFLKSMSSVTGN